jgi:PAS domain S-box-containing protein
MKPNDLKPEAAEKMSGEAIAATIRESLIILDEDLRILSANQAFLDTFRVTLPEIENRRFGEIANGLWNVAPFLSLLEEICRSKTELRNHELAHDFPGIGRKILSVNASPVPSENDSACLIVVSIDDLTVYRQVLEGLERRAELLDFAHDAIIVRNLESVITFWNRGAQETYGWSAAEACGNVIHSFLKTEFPEPFEQVHEKLFNNGAWEGELVHLTKAGKKISVASRQVLQLDHDGRAAGILEINRDTTMRKDAEAALRNLSARLLQLQDEERRRIARELHDSTGQSLAALVIHLSAVHARISAIDSEAGVMLREAIELSQKASDQTRTLSYLLYPPTLDYAGLKSALEWYIEGFTQRSKVKVDLELSIGSNRLDEIAERTLFRIVQESLTNIFRHSGSDTARVRISKISETVRLEVTDNGKGIPKEVLSTLNSSGGQLGVGIRGMRERVRQLGGRLEIKSSQAGTSILAVLPVSEPAARAEAG